MPTSVIGADAGRALDALQEAATAGSSASGTPPPGTTTRRIPEPPHRSGDGLMDDDRWRAGFAELARRGLTYDAWLYHPQIPELVRLAHDFPDVQIVLRPPRRTARRPPVRRPAATRCSPRRRRRCSELADCPNVALKLGGIGMADHGRRLAPARDARPPRRSWPRRGATSSGGASSTFGPDRCMFESNFPVDRASFSYVVLWNAFKRMVADAGDSERAALFSGTARRRVYRIA